MPVRYTNGWEAMILHVRLQEGTGVVDPLSEDHSVISIGAMADRGACGVLFQGFGMVLHLLCLLRSVACPDRLLCSFYRASPYGSRPTYMFRERIVTGNGYRGNVAWSGARILVSLAVRVMVADTRGSVLDIG